MRYSVEDFDSKPMSKIILQSGAVVHSPVYTVVALDGEVNPVPYEERKGSFNATPQAPSDVDLYVRLPMLRSTYLARRLLSARRHAAHLVDPGCLGLDRPRHTAGIDRLP